MKIGIKIIKKISVSPNTLTTNVCQDYRVSLLREIMERTKREGEQVCSDGEVSNRHTVCVDQV